MVYEITNGDLKFGVSLMSQLGEGNISISPYNIRTALAVLYEGARGKTAKEIANTAAFPRDDEARRTGFKELTDAINMANSDYTLKSANGLWINKNFELTSDFRKTALDYYMAEIQEADFENNYESERGLINSWVSGKTEGKIPELFASGSIDPRTVLALASALYFKAQWLNKFDSKYTRKQEFTLSNGKNAEVDMMRKGSLENNKLPKYSYCQIGNTQIAVIPYKGKNLASVIILPPRGFVNPTGIKKIGLSLMLNSLEFKDMPKFLKMREFSRLEIPKHELRGNYDLVPLLMKMGIERVFSDRAELQGIGEGPLYVSSGVHKTYFKTDEEGSEGAAATGFAVSLRCMRFEEEKEEPVEFVADRPFFEAVVHQPTGAVLFMNRVEDPR